MRRLKHHRPKRHFLKNKKRRPLKTIALLPSVVTLLNVAFGFMAIVWASKPTTIDPNQQSPFSIAAYLILFAMLADMLDGRLARMSQTTSSFGGQLDSLCDMVSFGVAPAFIMLKMLHHLLLEAGVANNHLLQRFLWLAALAYIVCVAIRLARFNVENIEQETDHTTFVGLPSPAAAGLMVSWVLFHQEWIRRWSAPLWVLPVIAIGTALLMVSRIPFAHVVNYYFKGKKPFNYLIWILLLLGLVVWNPPTALLVIFTAFVGSGMFRAMSQKLHGQSMSMTNATKENPAPTASPESPI